jgi:hypothetical protein
LDFNEFVIDSLERTRRTTLEMVQSLTQKQLRWQPASDANPVGFLLFHTFRAEDRYMHRWVRPVGEIWERDGWNGRWKLPSPPSNPDPIWTVGNSWTTEEVAGWEPPSPDELLEYGNAVRASTVYIVRGLDIALLTEAPRPERPQMTIAYYLHQVTHHEAQHQGQIDYILGLMKA